METESLVNFDFEFDKVINKIIMKVSNELRSRFCLVAKNLLFCFVLLENVKSECLKEALSEIDTSNDIIEIVISKEKEFIRLSSFGLIGDTHASTFLYRCCFRNVA